jgi:metal-responsive CopG/Arc/MetJ family transcriptional regulator
MKRMNITLPDELVELLEDKPNKSRFIAEAVHEKIIRERTEKLRRHLIEGYKNEKEEGRKVNDEWESGTLDSWE